MDLPDERAVTMTPAQCRAARPRLAQGRRDPRRRERRDEYQLMSIFGWLDPEMAAIYVKAANRKRPANSGMPLLAKQSVDEKAPTF
jgi:hypothetical protein